MAPAVGPAAREVGDAIDAAASEVARTTIPESFDALVGEVVETVGQAVNNEAIGEAVDTIARDVGAAVDAVAANPTVRQEVENIRYEVARIIDTLGQQRQVENLGWVRNEPPIVSTAPLPEERLATLRRQFERLAANEQRQRNMLAQTDVATRAMQDPEARAIITPPAEMPSNLTRAVTMIAADDPDLAEALATAQFHPDARVSVSHLTQTYGFADDKATRAWLNKMGYDDTIVPKKNNTIFTIAELERQRGYRANLVDPNARVSEGVASIDMINREAVTTMDALGDVVGTKGRAYLEANGYDKAVFPKTNAAEFRLADLDNAMANRRLLASIDEAIARRGDFSRALTDSDLLIGGQAAAQPARGGIILPGQVEPAAEPIRLTAPGQLEPLGEAPRLWTPESESPRSAGPIVSSSGMPIEGWRAPRGMIDFEEGGKAVISFFNSADPTTGHHELFHWYRRMLADIAGDATASPETRQAYQNLCDYVGAKPGEAWTREMDEKFAHTATDYLFGKPQPLPDTIREPLSDLRNYVQNLYALARDNNIPISGPMHNAFANLKDTQRAEADIEQMRVASEFESRAPENEFAAIHEAATPRAEASKLAATPLEARVEIQGGQADRLLADIQRSFETDTQATRMLQNDYRVFMDNIAQHDAEISRLTTLQQDPTAAVSIVNEARGGESRLFQDILTPEEQASLVGTAIKQLEDGVAPDTVTENIAKTISNAVTNAVDARNKDIVNFNAVKNAVDYIMANSPDKMADGLYGMLGGSRYVRQGARISVESLKQSMQSQLQSAFKVRIERELGPEVLKMFVKDKIPQEQLMAAVWSLSDKNYKYSGSQEALGVAKIYKDLLDQAFARTERTGMTMGNIDNYFIRQTHDQELIFKAGKEKYKDIARQTFDWSKIDGGKYIEDLEGRERFMDGCYSTLSTGYHYVFDGDVAPASGLRGWENTGTPHERLIQFKSPEAWSQYHTLFGVGSARAGMISSLNRLANLSAMTQVLGVDSKGNLNRIVDTLMNHLRSLDTPDALRQMRELTSYMKEGMGSGRITRLMSVLDGSVNTAGAGNQIVADVLSKYRSWKVMCNLGSALLSQLGDFVSSIREMQYQGDSLWKAIWGEIDNWTRRYGLDERQVASELGVYCDGMAADFVNSKYLVEGQRKGTFAKLQEAFTSVMGVEQYDNAHRRNMTMAMSHNLASETHLDFNNLSKRRQRVIALYMSPAEWNLIRQGGNEIANGRAYFTPQAADGIADASIARHLDSLGMPASKADIDAFRGQLKDKMSAYFWDRGRYAVLNPDAVTQAWTTWGAPRGTFVGEGMRLGMQYKSFTTSFMQRTLAREMYGYGADSLGAAIRDLVVGRMERGEGRGFAYLLGGGAVFGIMTSQLKQISRGAMPRDLTDPNTWIAGIAQSGGLGFISDALFADYNRYGGSNILGLLGPAASDAESLYNIYLSGVNGELRQQRIWSNVFGNIPFNNHFAVRAALNNLLFAPLRDMFQEDYIKDTIRKMEKRAQPGGEEPRMGGQAYWWAPGHLPFQTYN
ncbi:MAG: hypothetical protein LUJ25_04225 [Firmicutes bacterium]|nr:hypothetical protein [Bacillota bacterium]